MDMDTSDTNTANVTATNVGATTINRTTSVQNRFYRPEASTVLMEMDQDDKDDLEDDVTMRQSRVDTLKASRINAKNRVKSSEKAYRDFLALSDQYLIADNCRNPTSEQTEIINALQTSVSTIVLSGSAAAGNPRQQTANRISQRLADLKTQSEKDQKDWDTTCSEYENAKTALQNAKKKLGKEESQAIVDGRLMFCPFRGGTMARSSRDVIIEIWNMICGPQMLNLEYSKLKMAVRDLRASLSAEVHCNKPGKLIIIHFAESYDFFRHFGLQSCHCNPKTSRGRLRGHEQ